MFDFPVLISLIVSVLIFYFTVFINLKTKLDDLSNVINQTAEIYSKITTRRKNIKLLNILTVIFIIVILLLYKLPSINVALESINPISFSDIGRFLLKLVPFKEDFFSEPNFKFSYITGIILSVIILIINLFLFYLLLYDSKINVFIKCLIGIIIPVTLILGFLWLNNYVSLFLAYCIVNYFKLLSIILNIILYIIIFIIIFFIIFLFIPNTTTSSSDTKEQNNNNKQ